MLDRLDKGDCADIPHCMQTDAVLSDGSVRVGWMSQDLEQTLSADMKHLVVGSHVQADHVSRPMLRPNVADGRSLEQFKDMRPACNVTDCNPDHMADASRISFDMFGFCLSLTLAKFGQANKNLEEADLYRSMYLASRKKLKATYVSCPLAGMVLGKLTFIARIMQLLTTVIHTKNTNSPFRHQ